MLEYERLDRAARSVKERLLVTAAWMEAEGSFQSGRVTIRMVTTQVQQAPLKMLQAWWGGSIWNGNINAKGRKPTHQITTQWGLSGPRAAGLMMSLYALMMTDKRRAQIRNAINNWRGKRIKHKWETECPKGHELKTNLVVSAGQKRCRMCEIVRHRRARSGERLIKSQQTLLTGA